MNVRNIVANNIKYYRKKRNFSQEKLAEIANLHRTYISSVERCERNISIENIEKIAKALNIEVYLLLKERDENWN